MPARVRILDRRGRCALGDAVTPGAAVAVIGCGGVGLAVVQGARVAGAMRIVAVDVMPEKLAFALELGATDAVDASSGDAVAQVRELTGGAGVDFAFSAIGAPAGLADAVRMRHGANIRVGNCCSVSFLHTLLLRRSSLISTICLSYNKTVEIPAPLKCFVDQWTQVHGYCHLSAFLYTQR